MLLLHHNVFWTHYSCTKYIKVVEKHVMCNFNKVVGFNVKVIKDTSNAECKKQKQSCLHM